MSFLGPGNTGQCVLNLDAGSVITYAIRDETQNWGISTQTLSSKTTVAGVQVNGWVFAAEPSQASTGGCTNAGAGVAATATATVTVSAEADGGLSSGAKIGIGVGVSMSVVGLLTLLAGIWMIMRARRRDRDGGLNARGP